MIPWRAGVVLPHLERRLSPNVSSRHGARVRLIVTHTTEGAYLGACSWLCTPTTFNPDGSVRSGPAASAHVVLREDGREATQLVPWDEKAWSCAELNAVTDNLECAAFANSWGTRGTWPQLRVAARIVAYRLFVRGLPPRWARNGLGEGFCRHADLGAAGGGHHDPATGPGAALRWLGFVYLVKREYRRGFEPGRTWGMGDA